MDGERIAYVAFGDIQERRFLKPRPSVLRDE
jgi:hypothetical protein